MEGHVKFLLLPAIAVLLCCLQVTGTRKTTGGWGDWSQVSGCSKSCGMGLRTRVRKWYPGPDEPPLKEPFTTTEQFTCYSKPCPQNGSWSEWGMWAECSRACGEGTRKRWRDCNNPPPEYDGAKCEGEKFDEEDCDSDPCPAPPPNFNMSVCREGKNFTCKDGKMCVDIRHRCDKIVQCSDGSDETGCWRRGYNIGHVHFSNSASDCQVSHVTTILTLFISFWCLRVSIG